MVYNGTKKNHFNEFLRECREEHLNTYKKCIVELVKCNLCVEWVRVSQYHAKT